MNLKREKKRANEWASYHAHFNRQMETTKECTLSCGLRIPPPTNVCSPHTSAHTPTRNQKKWREMIVKNRRTPRAALETTHHHINDFTSFPFFSLTKTLTMVYKEQQWVGSPPGAYVDTDMRDERGKHKEEHDVRQKRILKHERYHLRKNSRCVNKFGGGTLKSKTRRGE